MFWSPEPIPDFDAPVPWVDYDPALHAGETVAVTSYFCDTDTLRLVEDPAVVVAYVLMFAREVE